MGNKHIVGIIVLLAGCGESHTSMDAARDASDRVDASDRLDADDRADSFRPVDCFAADTPIATPSGDVPIQALAVGDVVLSFDEARGQRVPATVVRTFAHPESHMRTLRLASGASLIVTAEHPFYSLDRSRYVPSGELARSARLLGLDGEEVVVDAWGAQLVAPSFNIEVAGHHNYFAAGVLVHNKSDVPSPDGIECGGERCFRGEACVVPCCGTEVPACVPPIEGLRCPLGYSYGTCSDGTEGCALTCRPGSFCLPPFSPTTCDDGMEGCVLDACAGPYCDSNPDDFSTGCTDCRYPICSEGSSWDPETSLFTCECAPDAGVDDAGVDDAGVDAMPDAG